MPMAGLQIIKLDSVTGKGIAGVKFQITRLNGEVVGIYTTSTSGIIHIPDLEESWYVVQELSSVEGYQIDSVPKNVQVRSGVSNIIEFTNNPYATLIVEKIDSVTGKGLSGVKFNITKANGEFIGNFTTDEFGQIKLSKTLVPATYIIKELTGLDFYEVDMTPQKVNLEWGDTKLLQVKNNPYGSLKIIKYDSKTNKTLEGVKYRLESEDKIYKYDYTTDKNGEILIDKLLKAGTYYLTEVSSNENYVIDETKHKIKIEWGKTTLIELKNTEITGKIQIIKKSKDNNEYNGLLANSLLAGAKFKILDENDKVVDTIITNTSGIGLSKSLPYGKYKVIEENPSEFYMLDKTEYVVDIKENNKIEVLELYNESVKLYTDVKKTGVTETQCLDVIRYDFANISNNSNVPLDNFIWHDSLPIETQIQKVYTGIWNENLKYKVSYKTNLNNNYIVFKDNLFTNQMYELDFTTIALQRDEYITDYKFEFGTVKSGFTQVESPFIYVKVNNYLKDKTEFINYTDVSGMYKGINVSANSNWKTIIYNKTLPVVTIPKTGE